VAAEDIPEHLTTRFENEKKRELEKRQEREEANNYCEIMVNNRIKKFIKKLIKFSSFWTRK
jgi:hypothetical protein